MEATTLYNGELGNGDYFLSLLRNETARLNALIKTSENDMEDNQKIPEDMRGKMRVAVGKAKMLLRKKFVQFEELCLTNLGLKSDIRYSVTPEDLAGYWDTTILQILQVYQIFEEVDTARKNNWEELSLKTPKTDKSLNKSRAVTENEIKLPEPVT